jgi:hypothetical protein
VPIVRGKCFEKAMRRSFFSRDNMENFIDRFGSCVAAYG